MRRVLSSPLAALAMAAIMLAVSSPAVAQDSPPPPSETPSLDIAAGERYRAGGLHRWFAGDAYRDLWTASMRVPVLDLETHAGGLKPTKVGGGLQTRSLRFETSDGVEYVFRSSDKDANVVGGALRSSPAGRIFQDQVSAMHPAAAMMSAPIMEAIGILHPTPHLVVMPDDPILGEFRAEFAGMLGMVEEFPNVPDHARGFGGATKIIDSQELVLLLDSDPAQRVDARRFLAARLGDFLINDNDRHPGNWKWARLGSKPDVEWQPIARDRDHAFVSYEGVLLKVAHLMSPLLVKFGGVPNVAGLTVWGDIDRRLLGALEKPVWDSVTLAVQGQITDSVINAAALAMPLEYQATAPALAAVLRARLAALPSAANEYYRMLAARVEVHGTAAPDRAVITRVNDRFVDVSLESDGEPTYRRRFDAQETGELLVYLHDGDDTAIVTGRVPGSILVRIIGGNGTNSLTDSSIVADDRSPARLYGRGTVKGLEYGLDTLFSRRPWEKENGELAPPKPDAGVRYAPLKGLRYQQVIGITPRVGVARYAYGFGKRPYASMTKLEAEYGVSSHGLRVGLTVDKRLESSPLHFTFLARMSDFEMVSFGGLGNATAGSGETNPAFDVRQRQWLVHPAIALALGPSVDISLGPLMQHTVTDSARSTYVSETGTYGAGAFNQAGVKLGVRFESRSARDDDNEHARHRVLVEMAGLHFPAALDVASSFQAATLTMGTSIGLPIPTRPVFVFRAGAKKLFGAFPFFEAATIGGEGTTRYMDTERYAGDASLYASSELRIEVAQFKLGAPLHVGILGLAEAGRVYAEGRSPGGWHSTTGAGLWAGLGDGLPVVTITRTTEPGRRGIHARLGLSF